MAKKLNIKDSSGNIIQIARDNIETNYADYIKQYTIKSGVSQNLGYEDVMILERKSSTEIGIMFVKNYDETVKQQYLGTQDSDLAFTIGSDSNIVLTNNKRWAITIEVFPMTTV